MYVLPSDVSQRALQLVAQLAVARDNPDLAPALRTAIELTLDAKVEFDAIADASDIPVAEIAAIAAEHLAEYHVIIEEGLAERAQDLRTALQLARLATAHGLRTRDEHHDGGRGRRPLRRRGEDAHRGVPGLSTRRPRCSAELIGCSWTAPSATDHRCRSQLGGT